MADTIRVTVAVDTDELRLHADRHAAADHHGVAHVLYAVAKHLDSDEPVPDWLGGAAAEEDPGHGRWTAAYRLSTTHDPQPLGYLEELPKLGQRFDTDDGEIQAIGIYTDLKAADGLPNVIVLATRVSGTTP